MRVTSATNQETIAMKEILVPIAILAGWFILNAWILPKFGVQT